MQSNHQNSKFSTKLLRLSASVIACISLVGCGDVNRNKIVGTWGIEQADKVLKRIDSQSESEDDSSVLPSMVIKFFRNGGLETVTKMGDVDRTKQGSWKFVSFDESTNTIQVSCDLMNQVTEHQIELVDSETIKLIPPNMAGTPMKLKFKRQP